MRKFALVCVFLLFGCSSTPATETAISEAVNSLNSIKETLPTECKTEEVEKRFADVSKMIEKVTVSCKADVKAVKNTNSALWGVIFMLLGALVITSKK
jgi:hypothetical protein